MVNNEDDFFKKTSFKKPIYIDSNIIENKTKKGTPQEIILAIQPFAIAAFVLILYFI